jgi:DNA-binding CsgD family transcriptional regulator
MNVTTKLTTQLSVSTIEFSPRDWESFSTASLMIHSAITLVEALDEFIKGIEALGVKFEFRKESAFYRNGAPVPHEFAGPGFSTRDYTVTTQDGKTLSFTLSIRRPEMASRKSLSGFLCENLRVAAAKLNSKPDNTAKFLRRLSRREQEVFPHLINGRSNSEIASLLSISTRTVEKHVSSILSKFECNSRVCLVSRARWGEW